jgi:hypothetical protein
MLSVWGRNSKRFMKENGAKFYAPPVEVKIWNV